jgi:hypothetical protein
LASATHHTDDGGVNGPGLYCEQFGSAGSLQFLTAAIHEPTAVDLQDDFIVFAEYTGPGGAEMYAIDRTVPGSRANVSGNSPLAEQHPAVHSAKAVWATAHSGPSVLVLHDLLTGTQIGVGTGERPAIWNDIVAFEQSGDIIVNTLAAQPPVQAGDPARDERFPAIGGDRVFFEQFDPITGTTSIYYVEMSTPQRNIPIVDPCGAGIPGGGSVFRPRVSDNGQYLLYTGTGCPAADGNQPLYLNFIKEDGSQTTYLIADLNSTQLWRESLTAYDIDQDLIAYQEMDPSLGTYKLFVARLNASAL